MEGFCCASSGWFYDRYRRIELVDGQGGKGKTVERLGKGFGVSDWRSVTVERGVGRGRWGDCGCDAGSG